MRTFSGLHRRHAAILVRHLAAIAIFACLLFPVFWLFTMSVKSELDIYKIPPIWFPTPKFGNYVEAFQTRPLGAYVWNSVVVSTVTTVLSVTAGALGGYGFSRFRFRGSRLLLLAMLGTRMLPPITLVFPLFIIMKDLGLLDSKLSLILAYTTFNIPFAVFLMTGFMASVPRELDEAAMIDGCSRLRTFFTIILPAVRPGLVATAIMSLLLAWKDFLWALHFTYSESSQTIPIGITTYITSVGVNWGPMTAVGVISILPLLVFSLIVQRHMIRGLTSGAVKE